MEAIFEKLADVFDHYPEENEVLVTSDGTIFLKDSAQAADNHARSLPDKRITRMTREDLLMNVPPTGEDANELIAPPSDGEPSLISQADEKAMQAYLDSVDAKNVIGDVPDAGELKFTSSPNTPKKRK